MSVFFGYLREISGFTPEVPLFYLELSSQVQQRIKENLKRGLPAEAFARTTVEFGNKGCYLSLAEVLHHNRLGTVFTDKTVCVFICAAFPWGFGE